MDAWIGIDVAKETLQACLLRPSGKPLAKPFANDLQGFAKLVRWAKSQGGETLHFCMESTGAYSQGLAHYLSESGEMVSVVNPARVKYFGMGEGILNKTDKVDARVIALYCRDKHPDAWRMSQPEVRQLAGLVRRLEAIDDHLTQEKNRLSEPGVLPEVGASIQAHIQFLEAEAQRLSQQIRDHIHGDPRLREDEELLTSITGIGQKTAHWILAELPDVTQFDTAKSAAAFAGLSPLEYTSGTSVKKRTRLSKAGNRWLRKALYMPALVAVRFNPVIAAFYQRLLEAGKHPKAALGAAMRKLLMIAYGVLKSREPFRMETAAQTA